MTLEGGELACVHHYTVADQTDWILPGDDTVGDHTAGDSSNLGDLEDCAYFCVSNNNLFELLLKHTFHGSLHIFDGVIDDRVETHFNFFVLSQPACRGRRANLESKYDRVGCRCKQHIRFRY